MDSSFRPSASGTGGNGAMNTVGLMSSANFNQLVEQKERELAEINSVRIGALEEVLAERDQELSVATEKLHKLKDDFAYNLRLLEDRDAELVRYDKAFVKMKAVIQDRDTEISELKSTLAAAQEAATKAAAEHAEAVQAQNEVMAQMRLEQHDLHAALEADKRELQREIHSAEDRLAQQRRELEAAAASSTREAELEHRAALDALAAQLRTAQGDVARLEGSLGAAEGARADLESRLATATEAEADTAKQLAAAEHALEAQRLASQKAYDELHEQKALLEVELAALRDAREQAAADHAESVRLLEAQCMEEREAHLVARQAQDTAHAEALAELRDAHHDALQALQAESQAEVARVRKESDARIATAEAAHAEAVARLAAAEMEAKETAWAHADAVKDLGRDLADARKEAAQAAALAAEKEGALKTELRERDVELQRLEEAAAASEVALKERRADIVRLESELEAAAAHEGVMEGRLEEVKAEGDARLAAQAEALEEKHDRIVRALQSQRDECLARLREQEHRAEELEIRSENHAVGWQEKVDRLQLQLDQAASESRLLQSRLDQQSAEHAQTVRSHADTQAQLSDARMRISQLERAHDDAAAARDTAAQEARDAALQNERFRDVIKSMRAEMEGMVARAGVGAAAHASQTAEHNRDLRAQVDALMRRNHELMDQMASTGGADRVLRSQLKDAQDAAERHRVELLEASAQLRREASRAAELATLLGAAQEETAALRAQVTALRGQAVDKDAQLARLRTQISLGQAHPDAPAAASGAAALAAHAPTVDPAVAALQRQVEALQARIAAPAATAPATAPATAAAHAPAVHRLQSQLDEAHADIRRLVGERETLLSISNKLRAELQTAPAPASPLRMPAAREAAYASRLAEIERDMDDMGKQNKALRRQLHALSQHPASPRKHATAAAAAAASADPALHKLDEVKASLQVAGASAPAATRGPAASASDRATASQRKRALRSLRRKREALIQRRRQVRNYAVREGAE